MAKPKTLRFDRNGIPIYNGEVKLLEEHQGRARDVFYGRTGTERHQTKPRTVVRTVAAITTAVAVIRSQTWFATKNTAARPSSSSMCRLR